YTLPAHCEGASSMSGVEDLEEIRQLFARYCHGADSDCEMFASCFTDDAVLEVGGVRTQGRDAIRQRCQAHAATSERHVTLNPLITLDGDHAEARSYFALLAGGEQRGVIRTGIFRDRLQKVQGRWLLSERTLVFD